MPFARRAFPDPMTTKTTLPAIEDRSDAGPSVSQPREPASPWLIAIGWLCVLGIAVWAVFSSIEIDRLGY